MVCSGVSHALPWYPLAGSGMSHGVLWLCSGMSQCYPLGVLWLALADSGCALGILLGILWLALAGSGMSYGVLWLCYGMSHCYPLGVLWYVSLLAMP